MVLDWQIFAAQNKGDESWNFNFFTVSNCSILFTNFETVFFFLTRSRMIFYAVCNFYV